MIEAFVFIFGLLIGSFLNVIIYRIPREEDIVFKRSNCPNCKKMVSWKENIPVLSFIFLKGKCKNCKKKISFLYPFIEITTGFLALYLYKNFSYDYLLMMTLFAVFSLYICQFFIDIKHFILPHGINLVIGALFLSLVIFKYSWTHWLIGGAVGFVPLFLFSLIYEKYRGQIGLGGGDIVLFGVIGIYLGPINIFHTITLSCILGIFITFAYLIFGKISKIDKPVPFGPAILIVSSIQILYPNFLENKLISLFG